jgi:hypothetical protein
MPKAGRIVGPGAQQDLASLRPTGDGGCADENSSMAHTTGRARRWRLSSSIQRDNKVKQHNLMS